MLRPTLLGLLLACAVSLSRSADIVENGKPMLWDHTATVPADLVNEHNVLAPNPWHVLQRQSLYKLMIAGTDPSMSFMGTTGTDSPIWGLPLQLGWMLTSGRLADPTGVTNCGAQDGDTTCISPESWWGCVNYFNSVLPFLSAAEQGFIEGGYQVQMQVPEGTTEFCSTYSECTTQYPDAMAKWDSFFKSLKASADSPLPENEKKDAILVLYWDAQMGSTYASAVCNPRQAKYSQTEVAFANSWLNLAEYVSAASLQSSLQTSTKFMTPLPRRILTNDDVAPNIPDLSAEENHTLSIFSWMTYIDSLLGGSLVRSWKNAMCSVSTREQGREMMEQLLLDQGYATSSFLSIVTGMGSC